MVQTFDVVAVEMDSPLDDGLHVLFKLGTCDIDHDSDRVTATLFHFTDVRSDDLYLFVLYFIDALQRNQFKFGFCLGATEFYLKVLLPDNLSLVLRSNIHMEFVSHILSLLLQIGNEIF